MFLDATMKRNPSLLEAAVELHRSGEILPNTYVLDLDAVEENAKLLVRSAQENGLELFFVCKQFGRTPPLIQTISRHIPLATAIEFEEARTVLRSGGGIGNVGHQVQIPKSHVDEALGWEPRFVTVFSSDNARLISERARALGIVQPVLVRVVGERDFFYEGQEGGVPLSQLSEFVRSSEDLPGIRVEGVTSFPCVLFNQKERRLVATPNLETLAEAKGILKDCGIREPKMNAPSTTCVAVMPMLREAGATHAEPGHSLTGTTYLHGEDLDQPEIPAMLYVTEVSHFMPDGRTQVMGGGFYPRAAVVSAAIYGAGGSRDPVRLAAEHESSDYNIDYYRMLEAPPGPGTARVGDTAVFAFRTQIWVTWAQVAVVSGVRSGKPELVGLFDALGKEL